MDLIISTNLHFYFFFFSDLYLIICEFYFRNRITLFIDINVKIGSSTDVWTVDLMFMQLNQGLPNYLSVKIFRSVIYSQTCVKRSSLGQRKSGLLRQVTS